jgi:subtilisin family serine protease
MTSNKLHLYLTNPKELTSGFKKQRNVNGNRDHKEEEEQELPKTPSPAHQERLREAYLSFISEKRIRQQQRIIEVPESIDLLTIHFYKRFELDLQKKFLSNYGLSVISYENFNKSVLFAIDDLELFENFKDHIQKFYKSPQGLSWQGTEYNLILLIHNLEFHTSKKIIQSRDTQQAQFSLIDLYDKKSKAIFQALKDYLNKNQKQYQYLPEGGILEISNLTNDELSAIVSSFDIIKQVTSTRVERLKPSDYGTVIRDFGFTTIPDSKNIKVGIIDTGVSNIEPLVPIISKDSIDITNTTPYWDENGHGTLVAGIVVLGSKFYLSLETNYLSNAEIVPIKVLNSGNGHLSVIGIVNAIKDAHQKFNVRIFNLSLNETFAKKYNSTFSEYSYLLDKLAYENDLIIFISAGNINSSHINDLQTDPHSSHIYPYHFYSPNSNSPFHRCELTNIATPADSLNNITVGALAGNFENRAEYGITPAKEYPAIYSRKFHYDYSQLINGVGFTRSQKNKFLNKPDLVFYGGDLFDFEAGIEVLRSPLQPTEKYYSRTCGTSLATPLVTSIAAQILKKYPKLKTQSIKSLLINSTIAPWGANPIHFRDQSLKRLVKTLVGFGMPDEQSSIFSNENMVTFIIEDQIKLEQFKVIPIALPKYITETENKLNITATLCYSFLPVKNNHLAYCPLQITFGFFKNLSASDLANKDISEGKLKSSVSWSDDFFGVENRLFSNSQKINFSLTASQIKLLGNELAIAIKCTGKNEIDNVNLDNLKNTEHKFSIAVTISELPFNKALGKLYNEIIAINSVEAITTLDSELEGDIEI